MTEIFSAFFSLSALIPLLFMGALAFGGVILKYTELPITFDLPTKASEAIKAGMLIERDSGSDTWVKVGAEADIPCVIVAKENPNIDKDTAFADGANVTGLVNPYGFLGILASGENVAFGAPLMSAAGGELQAATVTQAVDEGGAATFTITHSKVVGMAGEAVDASAAAKRITVVTR